MAKFGDMVTVEMKYEEAWALWALLQEIFPLGLSGGSEKMKDLSMAFEELSYTLGHTKERPKR